jgi:hypothetical protein
MWQITICGFKLHAFGRKEERQLTHATSNLGNRLNLKLVLYLEDLANPNNGLNLVPNCL